MLSPGSPSVNSGTKAPPVDALLELSEAIRPSTIPVPNFSGCFERFLATEYARILQILAPSPGRIPIAVPIIVEIRKLLPCPLISFKVNPNPLILQSWARSSPGLFLSSSAVSTSATANRPISIGIILNPAFSSEIPNVNRVKLVIGAIPTNARIRPIIPLKTPFTRDPDERLTIIVKENSPMEKYSYGPNCRANFAINGASSIRMI